MDTLTGLFMVFGPYLGCGKTAFLTWLAKRYHDHGVKVFANYRVKFPEATIAPAEILLMRNHSNCIILIDELWTIIDSRQSTSGENMFLNRVILTSRKRGVTIAGTSQMPHMLDKRFRDIADYRVLCERRGRPQDKRAMIKAHIGVWNLKAKRMLSVRTRRFRVADVCHLYDTDEEIEQNRRVYIKEMAAVISEDHTLLSELRASGHLTTKRNLLQGYYGVKRSLQDLILTELKLT